MKKVAPRVNLIPVIAKADALTPEELTAFKKRVLEELSFHSINYWKPSYDSFDDDETVNEAKAVLAKLPFAVIGSNEEIEVKPGRKVRARKYPWGIVESSCNEFDLCFCNFLYFF